MHEWDEDVSERLFAVCSLTCALCGSDGEVTVHFRMHRLCAYGFNQQWVVNIWGGNEMSICKFFIVFFLQLSVVFLLYGVQEPCIQP